MKPAGINDADQQENAHSHFDARLVTYSTGKNSLIKSEHQQTFNTSVKMEQRQVIVMQRPHNAFRYVHHQPEQKIDNDEDGVFF